MRASVSWQPLGHGAGGRRGVGRAGQRYYKYAFKGYR